jgi:hypothetical protein
MGARQSEIDRLARLRTIEMADRNFVDVIGNGENGDERITNRDDVRVRARSSV